MAKSGWHIDRRIPVSLIVTIIIQTAIVVIWAASYTARNDEVNKSQDLSINKLEMSSGQTAAVLSDMKADLAVVRNTLNDIKTRMK